MSAIEIENILAELTVLLVDGKGRFKHDLLFWLRLEKELLRLRRWIVDSRLAQIQAESSPVRNRILELLANSGEVGEVVEIRVLVEKLGAMVSKRTLKRHLSQLVRAGLVQRNEIGKNRTIYTLRPAQE